MEKDKIALIDADFLIYYCAYVKKDEEYLFPEGKTFEEICGQIDSFMKHLFDTTRATHYIGVLTLTRCFRYDVYPDYKANRKNLEKPPFYKELTQHLIDNWKFFDYPKLEADDVVCILKKHIPDSFIISPDKDILMLAGKHFNPRRNVWVETSQEDSELYFWKSMVIGDTIDNIKGIPGRGEKFASTQLASSNGQYLFCILVAYISHFGEEEGIEEFYKNYKMLKLLSKPAFGFNPADYQPIKVEI